MRCKMNTAEVKSLADNEINVLAIIMSFRDCLNPMVDFGGAVSKTKIEDEMNKAGFGLFETNMALNRLLNQRKMINEKVVEEDSGFNNFNKQCATYSLTSGGEDWLLKNEDNLLPHLKIRND